MKPTDSLFRFVLVVSHLDHDSLCSLSYFLDFLVAFFSLLSLIFIKGPSTNSHPHYRIECSSFAFDPSVLPYFFFFLNLFALWVAPYLSTVLWVTIF